MPHNSTIGASSHGATLVGTGTVVAIDASVAIAAIFSDEPLQTQALGLLSELGKAGALHCAAIVGERDE